MQVYVNKLQEKISGWLARPLSQAGRMVMTKSVLLVFPTYVITYFHLPKKICDQMARLMSKFWNCGAIDTKSLHWDSWISLCQRIRNEGLGFRDLVGYNQAPLANFGW